MGLDMGALGSISAGVRHKAAPPGPGRSPPALWGPLEPCPAGLVPWMAAQAPKPHPIRPQAGAVAMISGCRAWPSGGVLRHTHATKAGLGVYNTPGDPVGLCRNLGPL